MEDQQEGPRPGTTDWIHLKNLEREEEKKEAKGIAETLMVVLSWRGNVYEEGHKKDYFLKELAEIRRRATEFGLGRVQGS